MSSSVGVVETQQCTRPRQERASLARSSLGDGAPAKNQSAIRRSVIAQPAEEVGWKYTIGRP